MARTSTAVSTITLEPLNANGAESDEHGALYAVPDENGPQGIELDDFPAAMNFLYTGEHVQKGVNRVVVWKFDSDTREFHKTKCRKWRLVLNGDRKNAEIFDVRTLRMFWERDLAA